jgi:5-methylcytosine-specific restriction endonuclease McrA
MTPMAPVSACRVSTCPSFATRGGGGYCAQHARPQTAEDKGYGSRWKRFRAHVIKRHGLRHCGDRPTGAPMTADSVCHQERRTTIGNTLDHIKPVDGPDDPRFYVESELQYLCGVCHQRKRQRESQQPRPIAPRRVPVEDETIEWG